MLFRSQVSERIEPDPPRQQRQRQRQCEEQQKRADEPGHRSALTSASRSSAPPALAAAYGLLPLATLARFVASVTR